MAFALIAGLSPIYGLYAGIVGTITGAIFSGSSFLTISPTNATALAVGSVLLIAPEGELIHYMVTLSLLVGIIQLVLGVLKLGEITNFVSNAVMTGFIAGAGLLIILGQSGNLTGYKPAYDTNPFELMALLVQHIGDFNLATVAIGTLTIVSLILLDHTPLRNVNLLTTLIGTTLIVQLFHLDGVQTIGDISHIPNQLPLPVLPDLSIALRLLFPALAVAILGLVQSAGIAQNVTEADGSISDSSEDFVGQGVANIASAFFQGMPVGGSISRTAVNMRARAKTRLSNLFAGTIIAIILLVAGRWVEYVPLAALAGLLIVSAISLIDMSRIVQVWKTSLPARAVMSTTFFATLLLPLEYSIYVGVILSVMLYVYDSAKDISVYKLVLDDQLDFVENPPPQKLPAHEITLLTIYGNIYFASVHELDRILPDLNGSQGAVLILRLRRLHHVGSTFIRMLLRYVEKVREANGRLILAGVDSRLLDELERTNACNIIGMENIFLAEPIVMQATRDALTEAETWLKQAQNTKP